MSRNYVKIGDSARPSVTTPFHKIGYAVHCRGTLFNRIPYICTLVQGPAPCETTEHTPLVPALQELARSESDELGRHAPPARRVSSRRDPVGPDNEGERLGVLGTVPMVSHVRPGQRQSDSPRGNGGGKGHALERWRGRNSPRVINVLESYAPYMVSTGMKTMEE